MTISFGKERFALLSAGFVKMHSSIESYVFPESGFIITRASWMTDEEWENHMTKQLQIHLHYHGLDI